MDHSPLASNTCPDRWLPSGRVKVTISLYLGNLTFAETSASHSKPTNTTLPISRLTFSRITRGPLTPPMVLYRIRGVTLNDDDSLGSPMIAALPEVDLDICEQGGIYDAASGVERSSKMFAIWTLEGVGGLSCTAWLSSELARQWRKLR